MTFVNSHLAAFDDARYAERRNEDFKYLSERLLFPSSDSENDWEDDYDHDFSETDVTTSDEDVNIFKSDVLFWFVSLLKFLFVIVLFTQFISLNREVRAIISILVFITDSLIDLNYRIDLPDTDVRKLLSSSQQNKSYQKKILQDTLGYDQVYSYELL